MSDNSSSPSGEETKKKQVDLSELQGLSFGPDWTEKSPPKPSGKKGREDEPGPRRSGGGDRKTGQRDRRPPRAPKAPAGGPERTEREERPRKTPADRGPSRGDHKDQSQQGRGRGRGRPESGSRPPAFEPTVEVLFYPEDEPFRKLVKVMRASCRTFELFEIARLILGKPDRHVVVLRPLREKGSLYVSQPDGLPFEAEEEAMAHIARHHLGNWFEIEEVEVEPPKGNFQFVNKCGITGELLGPPNYHRYQEFLQQHHARRLPQVSFPRFQSKIETLRDEEAVQQWLEKMKKQTRYTLKRGDEAGESVEPRIFEGEEAARRYLISQHRGDLVKEEESVRLSGSQVQALPAGGNIRRSIEAALEQQNRFPLDTANHLRSRLRRMRFAIYKRGSKGVSYVCAVKRRFRDPSTRFSDSVDRLIQFIEKNPYIYAAELPEKFLGVKPPALEPPEPAAPVEASEASTEAEAAASGDDAGQAVAPSEDPRGAPASEGPTRAAETSEASPPSAADNPEVTALKRDLHWLVSEGYVSEFHDGRLFAQPVLEQARRGDNQTGERQHQEGLSQAPTSSPKEAEETSAESPTNTSTSDDASAADISKAPAPAATAAANESSPVAGGDSKEASAGSERVTRGEGAEKDEIISASDPAAATESVSEAGKPADPAEPNVPPANLAPADLEARGDSAASSENMEPTREEEPSSKAGETSREEA